MRTTATLFLAGLAACAAPASPAPPGPPPWVEYPGSGGPGAGLHVVLVSGDEEYRSEEALPMLGRLLAERHGFRCTVLFAIDKVDGSINPDEQTNIPGLTALDDADLLVLFTRFRRLPDADMAHIVAYVDSGRPVLGLRTATHAFAWPADSDSRYARWSWDSREWPGGFGRQVLGETWVAHHGQHGHESTRGMVSPAAQDHPILRGVADVWGPTDVYAITNLPPDSLTLLEGAVLSGMTPDSPPARDTRNAPRMPIAWCRERPMPDGSTQRVVCSTIGAAVDLQCEDLRRLLVNAVSWCTGLEVPAHAEAEPVGSYEPTMFGFGEFRKGVWPEDVAVE